MKKLLLKNVGVVLVALLLFGTVFVIAVVLITHFERLGQTCPAPPCSEDDLTSGSRRGTGQQPSKDYDDPLGASCRAKSPHLDHPLLYWGQQLLGCERFSRWVTAIGQFFVKLSQYQIPLARPVPR